MSIQQFRDGKAHLIPWAGIALTRERRRNPGVLVGVIPNSNTNASLNSLASRDDCLIILLLLSKERRGGRKRHPNIEFGDSNLNAERSERAEVRLEVLGDFSNDEVALKTDTVNGNVRALKGFNEVLHSSGFGTCALNVVVVDVELGAGIGGACSLEGDGDVAGAEGIVEYVSAPCSVVVEGFCNHLLACATVTECSKPTVNNVPRIWSMTRGKISMEIRLKIIKDTYNYAKRD